MRFIKEYVDFDWSNIENDVILTIPILSDQSAHRCENRISFVYFYNFTKQEEMVVGCNHSDLHKNGEDWISKVKFTRTLFAYNNAILDKFNVKSYDVDLCNWLEFNTPLEVQYNPEVNTYHRWYFTMKNVNDIIPITVFMTYCRNIVENFKKCMYSIRFDTTLKFYNDIVLRNFRRIESAGLPINTDIAKEYNLNLNPTVFTEYNMFTLTGRPSNKFAGVNYAAMEKTTGIRKIIQSDERDKFLIEFDYDSHHVRLVAKLIGYELPEGNLHHYFGRQYFNTPVITDAQYEESKAITFRMLYGTMYEEFETIEFFKRVNTYRKDIWTQFKQDKSLQAPLTGRKLKLRNFESMTQNKLFNYILQGYETDVNSMMINRIFEYLYTKKSKLILYTYDSFLFLYDIADGKSFVKDIFSILNSYGMVSSVKYGKNYHDMLKPKTI